MNERSVECASGSPAANGRLTNKDIHCLTSLALVELEKQFKFTTRPRRQKAAAQRDKVQTL